MMTSVSTTSNHSHCAFVDYLIEVISRFARVIKWRRSKSVADGQSNSGGTPSGFQRSPIVPACAKFEIISFAICGFPLPHSRSERAALATEKHCSPSAGGNWDDKGALFACATRQRFVSNHISIGSRSCRYCVDLVDAAGLACCSARGPTKIFCIERAKQT